MLNSDFKFKYSPVNSFLNLFIFIYIISAFVSYDFSSSIRVAMLLVAFMLFYYIIINSIDTKAKLHTLVAIMVGVGLLISLYGIYQFKFGGSFANSSFVDKEMFEDIGARVSGTFDNPNVMGEYLLLIIPFVISYIAIFKTFRKKLFSFIALGIFMVALLLTYSRGCYLGIILAITVFLLLSSLKFILLFIAGGLAVPFVMPKSIINRFASIGNTEDSSTSYRISIWKGAINLIKDNLFRPVGQGTKAFNSIYPLYALNGVGAEHTHNLFLQIAVETSILGLISFIILLFRIFQNILSGIRLAKDKTYKFFMIASISSLIGFIMQSIFDNTWYNNRIFLLFWIVVAVSVVCKNLSKNDGGETN